MKYKVKVDDSWVRCASYDDAMDFCLENDIDPDEAVYAIRGESMRNLVLARLTAILLEVPELQEELDISPDELQKLSNEELLELFEEIVGFND